MIRVIYIIVAVFAFSFYANGQQVLTGVIKNTQGHPLVGAKVSELGKLRNNTVTDENGVFSMDIEDGEYIQVNYADIIVKRVKVEGNAMDIVLDQRRDAIVNMGFLQKTEATQTQAVTAVYGDLVSKSATMKVNNALYGLISGLYAKQNTGWQAGATLNVRGRGTLSSNTPLVIVDGFPRGLTKLTLEEIESIQVLKDAAATALWGAKGANGVILINTKRGVYNTFDIDVNYRRGFNIPINQPKMADALTYVKAQEEALYYDGLPSQYNIDEWSRPQVDLDPDLYPNVDWLNEGTRDISQSNQFNLILRGGGKKTRFMSMIDYKNDFGILNTDYTEYSDRYDSQIRNYNLNLRMNIDVDVTPGTIFKLGILGTIGEDKRPNNEIDGIFSNLYKVHAAAFPIRTGAGNWGSNMMYKINPLAQIADVGYVQDNNRFLEADMRIIQDLSDWAKGLTTEIAIAYDNSAVFKEVGSKTYLYEVNFLAEEGSKASETYGTDTKMQITSSGLEAQLIRASLEAKLGYNRMFKAHELTAAAVYRQEMNEGLGTNNANYRQNVLGIVGYNYAEKYMLDVVTNYYGTSVLLEGDKFRFYPAVSAAWNVANESFMQNLTTIDMLKLRTSWGKSAVDNLSYGLGKYYWTGGGGYAFQESLTNVGGLREGNLPMRGLNPETSTVFNVGIDMRMWKNLTFTADAYSDRRTSILVVNNITSEMLGVAVPKNDIGEVLSSGAELSLGWNQEKKDFKYYANANWAYNNSEIIENGEGFQPYDYLYKKGSKIGQFYGLETIGYFNDQADIDNSPEQTFSVVLPGDVKYKDQNNDGKIDAYDKIPLGKSTLVPDMVFALNFGFEYKGFGVDAVFQGVSGLTKVLGTANVHRPLRNGNTNISTWYLDDKIRWTEDTKETANVPRLSTLANQNNNQGSTQWMADGSFLKLRNLNVYYNLPQNFVNKLKLDKLQVYARANNVFSIDKIQYFNCEDLSLGYPDMFSIYFGLNINL